MQSTDDTVATALSEMYAAWQKIEAAAEREFPQVSDEERYRICKGAMAHALHLKEKGVNL